MRHTLGLLFAIFLLLAPATSFAQDDAMASFEKGAALFYEGEYAAALVEFKKAHAASPNAMYQYNIAMCHVHLKRWSAALEAAEAAKKMGGLGQKGATQNDARIAAVQRVVMTISVADDVAANQPVAEETITQPDEGIETAEEQTFEPPPDRFGTLGWIGVGAAGVGAGLLAGALVLEVTLQPTWDEYREAAEASDAARYDSLKEKIESRQAVGRIMLFSGAGLAAIGATLIIVELVNGPSDSAAALMPLRGGGVAASYSLRF